MTHNTYILTLYNREMRLRCNKRNAISTDSSNSSGPLYLYICKSGDLDYQMFELNK